MTPDFSRTDLFGSHIATGWIGVLAVLALAVWVFSHFLKGRFADVGKGWPFFIIRTVIGTVALWLFWQFLARFILLSTPWSLWISALIGAAAIEVVFRLYALEKRLVVPWRGRLLLALRLAAVAIVILILVEPVLTRMKDREIDREVVVLIDDSQSMHLVDQQPSISNQLAVAALFEPELVAERPDLRPELRAVRRLHEDLIRERQALAGPESADSTMRQTMLENRSEDLTAFLNATTAKSNEVAAAIETVVNEARSIDGSTRGVLADVSRRLKGEAVQRLEEGKKQVEAGNHQAVLEQLAQSAEQMNYAVQKLSSSVVSLDEAFYRNLSEEQRLKIDRAASKPRVEIARQVLKSTGDDEEKLFNELTEKYNVRFLRFGGETTDFPGEKWLEGEEALPETEDVPAFRARTNLAAALEETLDKVPAESLAGVLLLSDGRHNAELPVEDAARQLRAQGSPLCAIPIGSEIGPKDASLLSLFAPESIYLGDRVAIRSELKLDGMRGQKATVKLFFQDEVIEEEVISVPADQYRTEVRFVHAPEEKGIFDYALQVEPVEGELFENNNRWDFKVAVTDDRTNVLVVDSFPRWEFRYLRNLFYGRDKSVHLQYVLLNPDEIEDLEREKRIYASAAREFGDAEASHLPENEEEWRKFDAIILGDIPPAALDDETWRIIRDSVAERGAMLVVIAGPRYMPHEFASETLAELLPVTYDRERTVAAELDEPFKLELTAAGKDNLILQQSLSRTVNQQIWGGIPTLPWRFRPESVKEGAEVLAYALPEESVDDLSTSTFTGNPGDVQAALEKLANQKEYEEDNALLAVQRFGLGRVVMLNFDSTWRFRYGVGDTYHHKFWGQMMRWGTGENLRSGGENVRLGTDQLSYTPDSEVKVTAKVLNEDRLPVTEGDVAVAVYRDNELIQRRQLSYREGSNGLYDTTLEPLGEEGSYRLVLEGDAVERSLVDSELENVETELIVVTTKSAVELSELTADHDFLAQTAQLTGGAAASLDNTESLPSFFGAAREVLKEREDTKLWDKWPLLLLFVGLVTTEWIFRRRGGLA